jgi:DNA-binding protein YbaB
MFDKVKQLNELRKMRGEAIELQKQLDQIIHTYAKGNIKVKVTGSQKIDYIEIDGEVREDIKNAINEAMKEVQKEAAKKMMEAGGGLSGLLGNFGK